ncbi:TauD/TfdA family dioxygenase [Thalassovita sp.]|uniref:TauD/TfdA family dioxygenase n=1 Tax=Thalassovita sp. TaxID=1979401 RepID=UPI0029DE80B0|nr:TauD/TfdA family dioxygenase [Thalassovita sp.]
MTEFEWLNLSDTGGYIAWRNALLDRAEKAAKLPPILLERLESPSGAEINAILQRCEDTNFAPYTTPDSGADPDETRHKLRLFAAAFGLRIAERHRSAGDQGIVALQPSDDPDQRGYIPYSTRALNWHTDGYYNAPQDRISAFVLHCVTPAASGGVNQILDPRIAYIRLRDADPAFVQALLHPAAMSIPANTERDGTIRPESIGPVFYPDPETGRMQMRFTARTRSIHWRDDPATLAAAGFLRDLLQQGDPLTVETRLGPGQGILNNNVLHNRTAFDPGPGPSRLMFRVRFQNRIGRKPNDQAQ